MDVWLFPTISYVKICKVHHPIVRNNHFIGWPSSSRKLDVKTPTKMADFGFQGAARGVFCCLVQDESAQVVETNGWNLKIIQLKKEKHLNQSFIFGFHVGFGGCFFRNKISSCNGGSTGTILSTTTTKKNERISKQKVNLENLENIISKTIRTWRNIICHYHVQIPISDLLSSSSTLWISSTK